jgi:hypothetical protein
VGTPKLAPYVWVFNKDGTNPKRRAPANLFTENDIYTIPGADGRRDLRLEHGFQQLEDQFTRIRNLKLLKRLELDEEQLAYLFAFVATSQARTKVIRDHHRSQWANIRKRMEEVQKAYEAANPKRKKAFEAISTTPRSNIGGSITLEDVKRLEERPIQNMIAGIVSTVMRHFAQMHTAILCTDDPIGFVTSDHPCTWFDPEAYKFPPFCRSPGLAVKTIEITLPVSPSQCVYISHNPDYRGYIDIPLRALNELNRRHIIHCNENFICSKSETRHEWFIQPELPDDAWEKVRARTLDGGK